MKLYLSSYKFGDDLDRLKALIPKNNKLGYIPNALDFSGADEDRRNKSVAEEMDFLREVGFDVELLDLRKFFGKQKELKQRIDKLGAVWVRGGNAFVLRQAMHLSGFDTIIQKRKTDNEFLYGAYSAGVCVLSPSLKGYEMVDDATDTPYRELDKVLWDGLGIIDYTFLPHYDSNHPESADIEKQLENCKKKGMKYKTLRDGDVIIVE